LFPKIFVLYSNTTRARNWIVGRKVSKGLTAILYVYVIKVVECLNFNILI